MTEPYPERDAQDDTTPADDAPVPADPTMDTEPDAAGPDWDALPVVDVPE